MTLIPHFELVKIPVVFSKTIGQIILESNDGSTLKSQLYKYLYIFAMSNYNIQWVFQGVLFILAVKDADMVKAIVVAPCFGFGFLANFKQLTLLLNKSSIMGVMEELKDMHPTTKEEQDEYHITTYVRALRPVMKAFAGLCLFNTICFSLYPLVESTVAVVFFGSKFDFPLGFPIWYPFDPFRNWFIYFSTYIAQLYAGWLTGVSYLVVDLLLVSSVTQLCMHFDHISQLMLQREPTFSGEDHKFLKGILIYHTKCLELTDTVDAVFRFSLLLNFLTSSGTICFVGFQMIAGSTKEIVRYSVLMLTSLAQVWIICIYGNKLIDASLAIGDAAFAHPWNKCDVKYRAKVRLMIFRSQKFAAIHAPTFPPISLQTFMKVISMSYQFFAVLQTVNKK